MLKYLRNNNRPRSEIFISYLVVGPSGFGQLISDALHQTAKEREYRIEVHRCTSVNEVLRTKIQICVDFIIFVFDSSITMSLEQIGRDLHVIDNYFFVLGTCCLVHGSGILDVRSLAFNHLKQIRKKYNIRYLSTDVRDSNKCMILGQKILNLSSTLFGLENGIPMITNLL